MLAWLMLIGERTYEHSVSETVEVDTWPQSQFSSPRASVPSPLYRRTPSAPRHCWQSWASSRPSLPWCGEFCCGSEFFTPQPSTPVRRNRRCPFDMPAVQGLKNGVVVPVWACCQSALESAPTRRPSRTGANPSINPFHRLRCDALRRRPYGPRFHPARLRRTSRVRAARPERSGFGRCEGPGSVSP